MECIAVKADFTMEYTANNMDFIMLYLGSDKNGLYYGVYSE